MGSKKQGLTREEILSMSAGREMDVLVAERVMGLVPCTSNAHLVDGNWLCHAHPTSPNMGGETHCYSSYIPHAWEVLEKIVDEKWFYNLTISVSEDGFLIEAGFYENTVCRAKTFPEAICKAALLKPFEIVWEDGVREWSG